MEDFNRYCDKYDDCWECPYYDVEFPDMCFVNFMLEYEEEED